MEQGTAFEEKKIVEHVRNAANVYLYNFDQVPDINRAQETDDNECCPVVSYFRKPYESMMAVWEVTMQLTYCR
ncbi:hypothetical protein BKA67DRAFT_519601 [Truncatella angustata]|uniref:Uncharacterized protein n=1 Tax=Truncatella angustata TaxID=152316 RepID=A0A9P8ZXB2_9PEZI|nr:uncharacterized protein BKA67DRAFT_519601 [Truncatella angustata]KAH6652908.1 hypothetical protein BKA67DRAFT_519601 [Truncatella angustata]